MGDILTPAQRRLCMSRVRSTDTRTEMRLRQALWAAGLRYRLRSKLPGKPDLVFTGRHIAVFVDGCFWHRCPVHATEPRTNSAFWKEKLDANVARDRRVDAELEQSGWRVLRFWEHDVKHRLEHVVVTIYDAVRAEPHGRC